MIVSNLKTPYYAVIFTTLLTDDIAGYLETAVRMEKLAELQEGFLGIESARNELELQFLIGIAWRRLRNGNII